MERFAYIETFGCQMNDRDSEIMGQLLSEQYRPTFDLPRADVVVVNTCSIRAKAEQKAYSLLGQLKRMKAAKPHLLVAVTGCVAQQEGERIFDRMPFVDLVLGPQQIYRLPEHLATLASGHKRQILAVTQDAGFEIPPFLPALEAGPPHKRFVTIMQGCNNYCAYCVVPYTRGREISRKFEEILAEVAHLLRHGVKEITLLGQNVNSYGVGQNGQREHSFAELLRAMAGLEGIIRLRFTTSNPHDLDDELMRCFQELPVLSPHFHLPVQSGSDRILKRMNRRYTAADYLDKVAALRRYRPDIALTTDLIVGFPGETEDDFQETVDLVETVRYHGAFSFKYSDRPQARSANFDGKLDEEVKGDRLTRLQTRINAIVSERNQEFVGQDEMVMVDGPAKSEDGQWSGRTGTNHVVNFTSPRGLTAGDLVTVRITEACLHSLRGTHLPSLPH